MLPFAGSAQRRWIIVGAVSMLALSALACGVGPQPTATPLPTPVPPTATPVPPTPVPPTEVPAGKPTAQPGGGTGSVGALDIVNETDLTICYVYISPTDAAEWGDDRLGADNVIGAYETFTITDIPVGMYDLRADDCDNNTLVQQFGVEMTTAGVTWTISPNTVALTVINNSSYEVCYLYVSPSTSDEWGPDQLGESQTIPSGTTFTLEGIEPGLYDLRAETCGGDFVEEYEIDLTTNFEYTITD